MKPATKGTPAVRKRIRPIHIPKRCSRCGRGLPYRTLLNSMAVLKDGRVTNTVGTCCLSVEELADLVLKEVTMEAAVNVRDGRVLLRPKRFGNEEEAS
jgi:hypothetical protein